MRDTSTLPDVHAATVLLKALADETRLRIVALLARRELCVCHITAALDLNQPNASQHLTILRKAGVVEGRRQGSWTHYRLAEDRNPDRARIVRAVVDGLTRFEAEAERLATAQAETSCA